MTSPTRETLIALADHAANIRPLRDDPRLRELCLTVETALRCIASAIEARSDATPKSDAAEGESAVPKADAQ